MFEASMLPVRPLRFSHFPVHPSRYSFLQYAHLPVLYSGESRYSPHSWDISQPSAGIPVLRVCLYRLRLDAP